MPADLIIYGLIAAGLIFWLRSILGTRNGEERDRANPYLRKEEENITSGDESTETKAINAERLIEELSDNPKGNMSIASKNVEMGLVEIARIDRGFNVYKFLQAAQDAFVYIVESFGDGDRDTLKELLSPAVYKAFDQSITTREKAEETMVTEIHAIQKSDIIETRLEGKKAFITVRFYAEETSVTKDKNGEILYGHPEKITQMRDVWTFCRDLKSRDPRWLVTETREDGEGDNEIIPNTQ